MKILKQRIKGNQNNPIRKSNQHLSFINNLIKKVRETIISISNNQQIISDKIEPKSFIKQFLILITTWKLETLLRVNETHLRCLTAIPFRHRNIIY